MALIACPSCGKRISDKAEICQHCNAVLVDDPEKIRSQARINRIQQSSRLMTYSFLALILFIGGLAYSGFYSNKGETWDKWVAQGSIAIGVIWYLVLRIKIMMFKREK